MEFKRKKQKFISLKEAADLSGYNPDYIGYLIREGKIPGKKVYSKVTWTTTEEAVRGYKSKKEKSEREVNDVYISSEVKNRKSKIKNLLLSNWRYGLIIFLITYLITGFAPIQFVKEYIRASSKETKVVNLYSQNCLGDWSNSENTQGAPEVLPEEGLNYFSEENSAVYVNGSSYVVCQDFAKEEQTTESIEPIEFFPFLPTENETTTNGTTTEEGSINTTTATSVDASVIEKINQIQEGTTSGSEESYSTGTETSTNEEIPISFFEKIKEIGNQKVLAQEENEQFKSVKIKFSFAIGEEDNILPVEEGTDTQLQATSNVSEPEIKSTTTDSSEEPISFWQKFKGLFSFENQVAKAEESNETIIIETPENFVPESATTEDIIDTLIIATNTEEITTSETQQQENTSTSEEILSTTTETSEIILDLDERIVIWYSIDGEMWWRLGSISGYPLSNALNSGYFEYDASFLENWEDIDNLKIKFEGVTKEGDSITSFLDSVWVEVTYDEIKKDKDEKNEELKITLLSTKKVFRIDETPEFKFKYNKKDLNVLGSLTGGIVGISNVNTENWENKNIVVEIEDYEGFKSIISPELILENNNEFSVRLNKLPRQFKPGKYKLKVKIEDSLIGLIKPIEFEQEFVWGVLAVNSNKSIFLPGESAYLQMAALRDDGNTICDAKLSLKITTPSGSTNELEVQKSNQCGLNNVTDIPDYYSFYEVYEPGRYNIKLTNFENGYEIYDFFEVRDSVPFDIERFGPTRIYPFAEYKMTVRIKSNQDFTGKIIENVPLGFEIKKLENSESDFEVQFSVNEKKIIWQVDWKEGETHELVYQFDAPDVYPYLYSLGPLEIFNNSGSTFQEMRQWQIASDAGGDTVIFIVNTASTTWTIPNDWNNSSNSIEVIGGGGGGDGNGTNGCGGGGGGAYARINNIQSLTPGATTSVQVGSVGTGSASGAGSAGGDTFFNRMSGVLTTCSTTMSVCAKGGSGGNSYIGGTGGSSTLSIGSTTFSGGNGGNGSGTQDQSGGGGGGAGLQALSGIGCNGGGILTGDSTSGGGGGGGGGGSFCTNGNPGLSTGGGNGGQGYLGTGGGAANGGNATATAGGGAGGQNGSNGGYGTTSDMWSQTSDGTRAGPGGGGGGAGDGAGTGGNGAIYGAGGGGGDGTGGNGAQGIIIISYYPSNVAPTVSNIKLNSGGNINLIESSATTVSATATVSDNNGYTDILAVSGKLFWSKATNATNCSANVNDCTQTVTCATSSCASNDCVATCNFSLWFPATPTDADAASSWNCWMEVSDTVSAKAWATNTSQNIEVNTLLALDITDSINYGSLMPQARNDPLDKLIRATTTGNAAINVDVSATNMCTDYATCTAATTSATNQHYATTSEVAYGDSAAWTASTSAVFLEFLTTKPTATPSDQGQAIYWGTWATQTSVGVYTGVNTFAAQSD